MKPFLYRFIQYSLAAALPFAPLGAHVGGSEPLSIAFAGVSARATTGGIVGQSTDARIFNIALTRGPELVPDALFPGYYDSRGWDTGSAFPGVDSGSYLALSFEVDPGYVFTPTGFLFYYEEGGSNRGPVRIDLRSSSDAFTSSLFLDTDPWDMQVESVPASALSPITGPVEFRWYGFGAIDSSGVLGLANHASMLIGDDPVAVLLEGDLSLVPEPRAAALAAGLLAALLLALGGRSR
jgi:hypothetical protein